METSYDSHLLALIRILSFNGPSATAWDSENESPPAEDDDAE